MKTTNLLVSSKITSTDDSLDYLSSVSNTNQNSSNPSTSNPYSDYSNPSWFAAASNTSTVYAIPALASTAPAATLVGSTGGFRINLVWDSTVSTAPSTFQAGIINAAQQICNALSNNIVLNISITCSGTGGGAYAGPSGGFGMSYATVKSDLLSHAATGDTTFNALPTGTSIQGQSTVVVWNAQLKLWGLATSGTNDGNATFAKDINSSLLPGVALHELTHVLGRIPYGPTPDIFDLFRYTSQGNLLFTATSPSAASYFSLDGGKTKIADYGINSDPSDFLNSGVQGNIDPFDEFYNGSTTQTLTAVDLKQLDALGFTIKSTNPTPTPVPSSGSIATFLSNLSSLGTSSFAITDSSANIALNIDALQTNNTKISSITQSGTAAALAITATQLSADATALNKISGSYNLTVSGVTGATVATTAANTHVSSMTVTDTGANIVTNLAALQTNVTKISSITQSNIGTALALTASQLTANSTALGKISGSYTLTVSGVTGAAVASTAANTHVSSMTVTDTGANIVANIGTLQNNAAKITSITQSNLGTALALTATQLIANSTALSKIIGNYTLTVSGVTGATVASTAANTHVSSMTVTDTGANIASNLDTLQNNIAKITSITQSNIGSALAITALQSSADNALLSKISGAINLTVTGNTLANSLYDTTNSHATLTGGAGIDTFNISGIDTITDLGNGGADIVKIALGASAVSTLADSWTATASTSNAASAATINTNGFNVNLAAATGTSGWTINATGTGTTSITGSIKNDTINGNTSGGLTINGGGGSDSIALGTHTNADTIYLVNNNKVTITGFGSSTGSVTDILNVTATGNALAGLTLQNKTTLATNNAPLAANSSGLVFNYANAGTALTAASAAALFSNTQATNKFAIAPGSGIELLIETGATAASTTNHVWKIIDTAGVFSAIELTGVTVAAGHNITFANFH